MHLTIQHWSTIMISIGVYNLSLTSYYLFEFTYFLLLYISFVYDAVGQMYCCFSGVVHGEGHYLFVVVICAVDF